MSRHDGRETGTSAARPTTRSGVGVAISRRIRSSILLKQTTFVVLVVILTGGTLILAGHQFVRRMVRDQIDQRLILAASDRQLLMQTYIAQQLERVALVASRTRLRQLLQQNAAGAIGTEDFRRESSRILLDAQKSSSGFLRIDVADRDGVVVTSTGDDAPGRNYSADPDFRAGRHSAHLGLPQQAAGEYRALLTAPLTADDGQFLGVVIVVLDPIPLVGFVSSRTGLGESGEVLVGTLRNGEFRLLAPLRHAPGATALPFGAMPVMEQALRGETGYVHTQDYRGTDVLAAYRSVGYQDWGLVAKMDVAEAYAPLARLGVLLIGLEGGLLVIGAVASYLLARRLVRPVLDLADKASAVAVGNLQVRVPVTSDDEIGQLARAFNQMIEQLAASYATLEHRVAERTAQLEAANRELESFSYSVAHDLRAPLRAMDGFSRLAVEEFAPQLPAEAQRYLGLVRGNAQQMGRLIDDLLAFSRLGRKVLDKQRVHTAGLVQEAVTDLRHEQEGRDVSIAIGNLPDCDADPALLKQVFANLLANALKFTRGRATAQIEVACRTDGNDPVYSVKDNGVGFDMQYAGKLFGVFQRLHRAEEFEGTGVGLAIVQRIIHRHGGRIWVEAEVDEGAAFYFTLGGASP